MNDPISQQNAVAGLNAFGKACQDRWEQQQEQDRAREYRLSTSARDGVLHQSDS